MRGVREETPRFQRSALSIPNAPFFQPIFQVVRASTRGFSSSRVKVPVTIGGAEPQTRSRTRLTIARRLTRLLLDESGLNINETSRPYFDLHHPPYRFLLRSYTRTSREALHSSRPSASALAREQSRASRPPMLPHAAATAVPFPPSPLTGDDPTFNDPFPPAPVPPRSSTAPLKYLIANLTIPRLTRQAPRVTGVFFQRQKSEIRRGGSQKDPVNNMVISAKCTEVVGGKEGL